jgi:hypothetical protein
VTPELWLGEMKHFGAGGSRDLWFGEHGLHNFAHDLNRVRPIFEAFEEKPLAKNFLKIVSCAGSSKSDREAQCHFPSID